MKKAKAPKSRTYSSYAEWEKLNLPTLSTSADRKTNFDDPASVADHLLRHSLATLRQAMKRPAMR